jgi:hypothetical protein
MPHCGAVSARRIPEPVDESGSTTPGEVARLEEERARLQAEVSDLRAQVAGTRARRARRAQGIVAALLVVVTSIMATVAVAGVWGRRNALNTDRWVETVGPVAEDPAVQQALANWTTTEIMSLIDPEAYFESVLPERGQALAAPLTSALRGFVDDEVSTFFASDTFERLWLQVNQRAHQRVVAVLEGDTGNLQIEGDDVRMNLIPVINQVLAEVSEASPELLGRTVELPTVTVDDIPQDAIARIEAALGREVPDDFGQFTVFEAQRLEEVQDAVSLFDRLVVTAVMAAVLLLALALWVSPRRRRTLLQLMVGIALGVVLLRRVGLRLEDDVVDLARPENQDAVKVVVGAFISSLLDATSWILAVAAAVIAIALLTGPYRWARALRRQIASIASGAGRAVGAAVTRSRDERSAQWVGTHRDALQLGAIALAILVLLVADLSWLGLVLLALVLGASELAVSRIAGPDQPAGARSP